jgi:hypothetical protein
VEVRQSGCPHGGLGLFACEDLAVGEGIVRDRPLVLVRRSQLDSDSDSDSNSVNERHGQHEEPVIERTVADTPHKLAKLHKDMPSKRRSAS